MMDTIANRLHKALSIRGLKQADLIRKTGINKGSMSCYLSGKYIPKQNTIFILLTKIHLFISSNNHRTKRKFEMLKILALRINEM